MTSSVSIVIPTLNAAPYVDALLDAIAGQSYDGPVDVLLVDSSSDDDTLGRARRRPFVKTHVIERRTFRHGAARNLGVRETRGDCVAFLSQDALPAGPAWLGNLLLPLRDGAAASYSRQIPRDGASPMERFFLETHFPAEPRIQQARSAGGAGRLGLSDVFFSNVSSAVRRDILERFPFREDVIMSEDQQLSRDLLRAGHRIAYQPESVVVHSHQYTLKGAFQRYFDSAYSLSCILGQTVSDSFRLGGGYVPREFWRILSRHPLWMPYYLLYLAAKTSGSVAGHAAPHLPRRVAKAMSLHKSFWCD